MIELEFYAKMDVILQYLPMMIRKIKDDIVNALEAAGISLSKMKKVRLCLIYSGAVLK